MPCMKDFDFWLCACMKDCEPWLVPIHVTWRTRNTSKQFPAMHVKFSKIICINFAVPNCKTNRRCNHNIKKIQVICHWNRFFFSTVCFTITLGCSVYRKRTTQFLNITSYMVDFYSNCLGMKMVVSQELVSLLFHIAGAVLSIFVLNLVAKPLWNFEFLVGKW